MKANWFAVQLKPNKHSTARENLRRQGYRVFLPLQTTEAFRSGRRRVLSRPLFPGYLFVLGSENPVDWRKIGNSLGVQRVVTGQGGAPAPMPKGFVEQLMSHCDDGGTFCPGQNFQVGDHVALVSGPFAGLIGEIAVLNEGGRLGLLLDLMGRCVRAEVDIRQADVVARNAGQVRAA